MIPKLNIKFPLLKPYGTILTWRSIFSIGLVITNLLGGYRCPKMYSFSSNDVIFSTWSSFSLISHTFNFQKNLTNKPSSYFYIPYAYFDFIIGIFASLYYLFESSMCIVCISNTYYYVGTLTLIFQILSFIMSTGAGCLYGYYSLLLHVQTQNIKDLPVKDMVVMGDKISYITPSENFEKQDFNESKI
uniref:VKc domain-containing protein n=1 Tax=Parastrongyloides trichosuri TaxID=131310 RepID=A0A0N4ZSJ0_PARTI